MSASNQFPAAWIVHTPSGPSACCERHAERVEALMEFMGAHTNKTGAVGGEQCANCAHEAARIQMRGENDPQPPSALTIGLLDRLEIIAPADDPIGQRLAAEEWLCSFLRDSGHSDVAQAFARAMERNGLWPTE